jgi:farnesyl-diphosphate farnesyltransferase
VTAPRDDLLGDLLRGVSRSFYLSLAILPSALRRPIGLAYLLARAADTVADTRVIPRAERRGHLAALRRSFAGEDADPAAVAAACSPAQGQPAERRLLARLPEAVAALDALDPADARHVRAVLATLTSGMILDLERFPGEDASQLTALASRAELDHYTYLVAGCVGEFWTSVHVAHRPRLCGWDETAMRARGVRLGKALQLTNVLRDAAGDLRHGRCYLPADELAALGLAPGDLLDPHRAPAARPVLDALLGVALEHYDVGWRYTLMIPRAEWRMRLACAWPLLIGLETLAALAADPSPLTRTTPVKVTRRAVRGIVARSALAVWSNRALAAIASRVRGKLAAASPALSGGNRE